jgi:hypothetical protein
MRAAFVLFTSALVAIHVAPLAAQRAEIRTHIDAYVAALSSGSPDQFERMAKEHFSPELVARTADQR